MTYTVVPIVDAEDRVNSALIVDDGFVRFHRLFEAEGTPLSASAAEESRISELADVSLADVVGVALANETLLQPDVSRAQSVADWTEALGLADVVLASTWGGRVLRSDFSDSDRTAIDSLQSQLDALANEVMHVRALPLGDLSAWQEAVQRLCAAGQAAVTDLRTRPLQAREDPEPPGR